MTRKIIAKRYIDHLERGDVKKIIDLFNENGVVHSPLYGVKTANAFYNDLSRDTTNSELRLLGIFEDDDSNHLALYFTYIWTLKNNKKVEFDVVDIIEFDIHNKINKLKIIYDTVITRELVGQLSNQI
ncbi:nuclear transport factor 2 family protein [Mariniflexile sp. AS56]|uniref:nuclear transport factor 2 family protein n=1 Tax=Mariniflexile sp. AS56 TaxID=3063957 RepID=UPI0026EC349E|nr:nuclear transport factor 2 family protein [Mariniflexile sp. AS56]MDO7171205.1 nuclear transport factor 2 family protein [Mariniflexile sp. AS56]